MVLPNENSVLLSTHSLLGSLKVALPLGTKSHELYIICKFEKKMSLCSVVEVDNNFPVPIHVVVSTKLCIENYPFKI